MISKNRSIALDRLVNVGLARVCIAIVVIQIAPLPDLVELPVFVALALYVGFLSRHSVPRTAAILAATMYSGVVLGSIIYWDPARAYLNLPDALWMVPTIYFLVWTSSVFFVAIGKMVRQRTHPVPEPLFSGSPGVPIADDPRFKKLTGAGSVANGVRWRRFTASTVVNILLVSVLVVGAASCAVLLITRTAPSSPGNASIRVDITPQTVEALTELDDLATIAADHDPRTLERIDTLTDVMESTRDWATEEWTWWIMGFFPETGDRPIPKYSADTIDGLASDLRGNAFTGMCETVTDVEQCHSRVRGVADTFHSIATEMRKP